MQKVLSYLFLSGFLSLAVGFCPMPTAPAEKTQLLATKDDNNPLFQEEISRRVALVLAAATAAAGVGTLPAAVAMPLSGKVEALEYENKDLVNVKGAPEKHLPQTTVKGTSVKVVVPHVMDPEKPHFIEYLWLKDEDSNKVIEAKHFVATDAAPPTLVAKVAKGTKVRPLLFCNLHGLWQGESFTV
ncbi:superoxide reductase [Seminavis robusta]|uniref:Superoxide reductase n=1 Tax=Seminavis robusta TaxID=568900 RepID=A0A9N8EQW7_9STRA|nr:superoxide reductase [Seminavis robusta]|eukprot:Sro1537_g280710.1 superoxide reductase (186) ;mRNA; r:21041-21598